jgi:CheY-like chemotaxis protein
VLRGRLNPLRVLVVEDVADGSDSLAVLLRWHGYLVELVRTGRVAVEVALRWRPDVVLIDRPGYAIAEHLGADPRLCSALFIAVTGDASTADLQCLAAAGIPIRLAKPIDPNELLRLLERVQRFRPPPVAVG